MRVGGGVEGKARGRQREREKERKKIRGQLNNIKEIGRTAISSQAIERGARDTKE